MIRIFLLLIFVSSLLANEHWFVFDQYQFPGFYTPLFTLISTGQQKNLSFALSTYERSINIDISIKNSNETIQYDEQSVKLNIERADLLYNTLNHLIFLSVRQQTKFETYVNCKLIDSYYLYPSNDDNINENSSFKIENLAEGIKYFQPTNDEHNQQEIFDKFGCKTSETMASNNNKTTFISKPLIRKMQHVIEKVQRRKQRSR